MMAYWGDAAIPSVAALASYATACGNLLVYREVPPMVTPPANVEPQEVGFPPSTFPTVFADGVISLINSAHVVKFFLGRTEPEFSGGTSKGKVQAFEQVIMPIDGFASTYAFFEGATARLVRDGLISQEAVDNMRRAVGTKV
jgi:hypothetical protein